MATDDGELTFIRCPSCSSLIPAVAARCRMCGHGLEEEASSAADENGKSRIRHRKATNHSGVLKDFSLSEEPTYEAKSLRDEALADSQGREQTSIQEVFEPVPQDLAFAEDAIEPSTASREESAVSASTSVASEDSRIQGEEQTLDNILGNQSNFQEVAEDSKVVDKPKKKRRRKGRSKAFSGSNGTGYQKTPIEADSSHDSEVVDSAQNFQDRASNKVDAERTSKVKFNPETSAPAEELREELMVEPNTKKETSVESQVDLEKVSESKGIQPQSDLQLVGWLVSYSGNTCSTIEVREGRFFISAESVKGADLVIENMNLSVPHCLVRASTLEGIRVQDLMSDGGTFIKKQTDGEFRKVDDSTIVEHGDWIRAGDYEALVCLIPFRQATV